MTGQQLKQHLFKHGIKGRTLADELSIAPSAVSAYFRREKLHSETVLFLSRALKKLGHPFEEPKPSTFGTDKTDHTTLVRLTNLQHEVNMLREMVSSQRATIDALHCVIKILQK